VLNTGAFTLFLVDGRVYVPATPLSVGCAMSYFDGNPAYFVDPTM
jgi:hypothetical protein